MLFGGCCCSSATLWHKLHINFGSIEAIENGALEIIMLSEFQQ